MSPETPPTASRFPNVLETIHAVPGRVRFRLRALRDDEDGKRSTEVADRLVALRGVLDVSVKPTTGSILVVYDAARLSATEVARHVQQASGAESTRGIGEAPPCMPRFPREPSKLAVAAAKFFEDLNEDVLTATEGHADLATLMPLGFVGFGLAELAATREMPAPPWWSLFWWSFRSFLSLNDTAIQAVKNGNGDTCPPLGEHHDAPGAPR